MKNSLLALFILFSTIAFGQDSPTQAPKIAIKVTKGETITLDGIKIKFAEVLEDSRCPTNVNCIWAGRAKVKVEVTSNGKTEEKILIFGEVRPKEEKNTNLYSSPDFAINGLKLNPYPVSSENMGTDKNYVLLICKEKNS